MTRAPSLPPLPANVFTQQKYVVRRKVIKLLGGAFHVYDANENVIGYSKMKAFKLKEDIRLYTGEDMTNELLTIKARSIMDLGTTYDVVDPRTQQKVGALRRKALKSMIRDEWAILNPRDQEVGLIQEDSTGLAIIRRFVDLAAYFIPQKYFVTLNGVPVANFSQNKNPFVYRLTVDMTPDATGMFDRRLAIAAAILLAAVEGKQA
jgi:uncharacterized protein YxjI